MTDRAIGWLTMTLGGKVSGEGIIFLISMIPSPETFPPSVIDRKSVV